MAVTEYAAGTQSITTSEHSLTTDTGGPDTDTTAGCFQVVLDLSALANGDVFDLYGYEKAQSSDTQRRFVNFTFAHAQSIPNWISPQFMLLNGWDFTLIRSAGSDRTITWSIRRMDDAAAAIAAVDGKIDTIDNLLDTEIAAIKAKTDQLTFTVANQIDANIESVNGTTVTGAGSEADPWGP
jgi:hypothetical protein